MKLAVIAAIALAGLPLAHAQEAGNDMLSYRVRPGDSLELIAAEVYGDSNITPATRRSVASFTATPLPKDSP